VGRSTGPLILVAVFLILGAAVYFAEIRPSQEQAAATATPSPRDVFSLTGQQWDRLVITGSGKRLVAEKEGDDWQIREPDPGPGDNTALNGAFFSLESLRAFRLVAEEDPDLAKYGLADPVLTVEFRTTDGQEYGLAFGNENVDQSYRFAKRLDSPAIYLIQNDTYRRFEGLLSTPPFRPTPRPAAPSPSPAVPSPSPGS
jgi:hypothetical protein